MAIVKLVHKTEETKPDVSEVLDWLERTKDLVKRDGVTNIAISYVTEDGRIGSGYISYQPAALIGATVLLQEEIIASQYE